MASLRVSSSRWTFDELVRPERVLRIFEDRFQLRRSSRRIDLIVDGEQLSGRELRLVVATVNVNLHGPFAQLLEHRLQLVFRQA